jgi:hypothetical protein
MRIGIDDRFARKIFRLNPSTVANHLALIRSFLIDSDPSAPSRAVNCAKVFCCAQKRAAHASAMKFGTHARICASLLRAARGMRTRKKSLFYRVFATSTMCAQCDAMCLRNAYIRQHATHVRASTSAEYAPRTRFVKPDTVFFVVL